MTDIQKVLNPSRRLESVIYEEPKPEPKQVYFMFPKLVDQLRDLRIDYRRSMDDIGLDNFMNTADKSKISKRITNMVRLREKDFLNEPKTTKEWLMWYEDWESYDAQGHKIPSVTKVQGFDWQVHYSTDRDSKGNEVYREQDRYKIYLVSWSIENFEQALENAPHTNIDKIGFICNELRSWGGFSYDEFKYLPFEELAERGRTGKVLQPVPDQYKIDTNKKKHK